MCTLGYGVKEVNSMEKTAQASPAKGVTSEQHVMSNQKH